MPVGSRFIILASKLFPVQRFAPRRVHLPAKQSSCTAVAVAAAAGVMASDADPAEPLQPEQIPLPDPVSAAAAGGEPAAAPDAADVASVELIPDGPDPPVLESPPLPAAYLPKIETNSISASLPAPTAGRSSSSSSSPAPSYATLSWTQSSCSATCTGFRIANTAEPGAAAGLNNSVVLIPASNEAELDPMGCGVYPIAKLRLTNGGLLAPTGARMITVPITTVLTIQTPKLNKSSKVTLRFNVMWSLGGPVPNQAGIFALNMRSPRRAADFSLSLTAFTAFNMRIEVVGFTANPNSPTGSNVVVLGDWGQPWPLPGNPLKLGPRVYVKPGRPQVVQLMVRICKSDG